MNYELAKKLNNAGFPQVGADTMNAELDVFVEQNGDLCRSWNRIDRGACRVPTLSELIEACGERFLALLRHDDKSGWTALKYGDILLDDRPKALGATTEEAVAHLWLALHPNV